MKKKFVILNSLMSIVILFAILFQSLHSFEHLTKELTEKKCFHKHVSDKQITHEHQDFDKCFVCEFAFSSYISSDLQSFRFHNYCNFYKNDSYFLKESHFFFTGISYSLRGPPIV
jgi:hypothetical protein